MRRRPPSSETRALSCELHLQRTYIEPVQRLIALQGHSRGDPGALPAHRTTHHVARRGVRYVIAADAASRDQQVAHALGHERAIRHVPIAARGRQNQDAVAVDELREYSDGIL